MHKSIFSKVLVSCIAIGFFLFVEQVYAGVNGQEGSTYINGTITTNYTVNGAPPTNPNAPLPTSATTRINTVAVSGGTTVANISGGASDGGIWSGQTYIVPGLNWASPLNGLSSYQNTYINLSNTRQNQPTGQMLGPGDTVLVGALWTCSNGTTGYSYAAQSGGSTSILVPYASTASCTATYDFQDPATQNAPAASVPPPVVFTGAVNILNPATNNKTGTVPSSGSIAYNVSFKSVYDYSGPVYLTMPSAGSSGACPTGATCAFGTSNFNIAAKGTFTTTLTVTTNGGTATGTHNFRVNASPTNSNADPLLVYDVASVYVNPVPLTNHAQFISYQFTSNTNAGHNTAAGAGNTAGGGAAVNGMPTVLDPGETGAVNVTMNNNGTTTWFPGKYSLHSNNPGDNNTWGTYQVPLPILTAVTAPNVTSFEIVSPWNHGGSWVDWQEVEFYDNNGNKITPSGCATSPASGSACLAVIDGNPNTGYNFNTYQGHIAFTFSAPFNLALVKMMPGILGWGGATTVGTADQIWATTNGVRTLLKSGFVFTNAVWTSYPTDPAVGPGGQVTFSVPLTAPRTPGTYNFQWRMHQDGVQNFDDSTTNVPINIPQTAPTVLLTALVGNGTTPVSQGIVMKDTPIKLQWTTSANPVPDSCTASGSWNNSSSAAWGGTGPTVTGGSWDVPAAITGTPGDYTFNLQCSKSGVVGTLSKVAITVQPPPVCNMSVVGTNRMEGCVVRWTGAAGNFSSAIQTSITNPNFVIDSVAPIRPVSGALSSPAPATALLMNDNWGGGLNGLTSQYYAVWRGKFNFAAGSYDFTLDSDDGSALYIDGALQKDYWSDHAIGTRQTVRVNLSGEHLIAYYMYQNLGGAGAYLAWDPASMAPTVIIEGPVAGQSISGQAVYLYGWAIDNTIKPETAISSVKVYVDGNFLSNAAYGNPRGDVCNVYPGRPGCPNVGYYYNLDTSNISNGAHTIRVDVTDSDGPPAQTASASVNVTVSNTLSATLQAATDSASWGASLSGAAPFNGVDFRAQVGGTAGGTINYKFDCTNDGTWDTTVNGSSSNPYVANNICNYAAAGNYTAKVQVERGTLSAQSTVPISVIALPTPSVSTQLYLVNDSSTFRLRDIKDGDILRFRLTFTNIGIGAATQVDNTTTLSPNLSYLNNSYACASRTAAGRPMRCSPNAIGTPGSPTLTFRTSNPLEAGDSFTAEFEVMVVTSTSQSKELLTLRSQGTYNPGSFPFDVTYSLLATPSSLLRPDFQEIPP